ncbi:hypothetical protein AK812_SmicGene12667 [Symbiodinium microadriaticum]|uniref:Uncharacterized protein n=1 Tax=Symbiodinium microadriaticum TaxID=2951 RepID=A0A1Q9EA46_SYMMI|nr:hypothetical protein AK812_SmicGene12667 [Symbiodinium microadriaticum]
MAKKVVGLLYDLLVIAPNSKLLAVKVRSTLESLHRTNDLTIAVQKGRTDSDQFDKLDLTIRLLMNHIRQVKQDDKLRSRLWRLLTRAEQLKLELCLEKVDLQLTFEPESKSEGAEVNLLQLVPWKPPSELAGVKLSLVRVAESTHIVKDNSVFLGDVILPGWAIAQEDDQCESCRVHTGTRGFRITVLWCGAAVVRRRGCIVQIAVVQPMPPPPGPPAQTRAW